MANTLFTKIDYTLSLLIDEIASGQIGLPEIQRPFVWKNVKVRDLFDSMYRGFPIGHLVFWETGARNEARRIGVDQKQLAPTRLIVDGQQRLTSLYAVVKGFKVIRDNFSTERIEIAFNPLEGRFEVPDAAIRRDRRFIPNISAIWDPATNLIQFAHDYAEQLQNQAGELTTQEKSRANTALDRLHALLHFPFTALQLSSKVEDEQVSEVFVRINSQGKPLNQSDFILTLMSVFWDEGRTQLEDFSRRTRQPASAPSPYNYLFRPDPDQLLRVAVGAGFRRARLSAIYSILRGRNADNDGDAVANREVQFERLKQGQAATLNVQYWQDFMRCVTHAGYRSPKIISSENNLIFAYILYLIGRTEIGINEHLLRKSIAQWLSMSCVTGRFTNSPESQMEFDLARLRTAATAEQFIAIIHDICSSTLTSDFWSITLPQALATSAARSPSMFAFFAALNVLDAPALYSTHSVRELMDPATQGTHSSLERHHLFPVAYLKRTGIADQREYNQIANYAIVEWMDNGAISDSAPSDYVPRIEQRFDRKILAAMYHHHALPANWQTMPFETFLQERRVLIAGIISDAYHKLTDHLQAGTAIPPSIHDLIAAGESSVTEFKSTLRTNLHTGEKDTRMETAVLKSIAGFLNTHGGTLIIGIADDGTPKGVGADGFADEDKMLLHLINLLKERLGGQQALNVHPRFSEHSGVRVLVVDCDRSKTPVFVKDGNTEHFFVRYGPSTQELTGATAQDFIHQRFGA